MEIMLMEVSFPNNSLKLQNVMKRTRLHLEERELRNPLVSREGMHHCVAFGWPVAKRLHMATSPFSNR